MTNLPMSATTPISISDVGLKARNGDSLASYYQDLLGLEELTRENNSIVLGAGGRRLLTIEEDRSLKPDNPREAGLYHTAFLFPERADLARWTQRAIERKIAIEGASDHLASEAIYLTDPEGNGIEIYTDRPSDLWQWEGKEVVMKTLRLDFHDLLATPGATGPYERAPEGTVIGHVHLRVGDPMLADRWWHEEFGFDTMAKYGPQAVFLSSGGYHHHIGANSWHSAGAGQRDESRSGLSWVAMKVPAETAEGTVQDPWGTTIRKVHG
jgi:catechol 2,3-dioxygenase